MKPNIVSMFDESGNALRPWANAGYPCHAFDLTNTPRFEVVGSLGGFIIYHKADFTGPDDIMRVIALRPAFLMGFPPCTDLAVSGSKHFAAKAAIDPLFQFKAAALARTVEFVGYCCGCPWFLENPVSRLATIWRKPNVTFSPNHYGGYLPVDDVHPRWPKYITARDAYEKKTCLWYGGGYIMPMRLPVVPEIITYENGVKGSRAFTQTGGKSAKTKQIRSETPRGFALASWFANQSAIR